MNRFRKHGKWFMYEEKPGGGGGSAAPGEGIDGQPGGDNTPPDPPAGGEKPEDAIPKSRFDEVIAERNTLREQVSTLGENLSTVLARVDELAGQGKSKSEIAEIVSEEAKEWGNSKGFNEAVQLAVRGEMKKLDGKIGSTLQMQARVILNNFKKEHPDLDEKDPEFVKRIQSGYTLDDAYQVVFSKKTLGSAKEIKQPGSPARKPAPDDSKLKAPKTPISLRESFKRGLKNLGLNPESILPKE